ncbi:MAG: hypothetical protein H8D46_03570 [FCB group bacterium]|nr:hypothetical protein [FCB group bacterium]
MGEVKQFSGLQPATEEPNTNIELEELCYSLVDYIRKGEVREIAHSLNNMLTPLQIQYQLMTFENNETINRYATALERIIDKLKEFSAGLMVEGDLNTDTQVENPDAVITNLVQSLTQMPSLSSCQMDMDLNSGNLKVELTEEAIRFIITSFIIEAHLLYSRPRILISSEKILNTQQYQLCLTAEGTGKSLPEGFIYSGKKITDLNYIPLKRLQRILHGSFPHLDFRINEAEHLEVICLVGQ